MRLFLCEKPSQGKDIARVLGATQRGESYGEQYKRLSLEQLPIVLELWLVGVKPKTAAQFKITKKLLSQASELVIPTDADCEGETIAREVIELCDYLGPIQRLWLSAQNGATIQQRPRPRHIVKDRTYP